MLRHQQDTRRSLRDAFEDTQQYHSGRKMSDAGHHGISLTPSKRDLTFGMNKQEENPPFLKFSRRIVSASLYKDQPVPEVYRYCLAC